MTVKPYFKEDTHTYLDDENRDIRLECITCPKEKICPDKILSCCGLELLINARLDALFLYGSGIPSTDSERDAAVNDVIDNWRMKASELIKE
jgi:hypothetical protein